ncbi:CheY chemotaxis protein or a CheY-like REC (receiver) domain [Methanosarcina thermophila]|jgi:CheY-like chemotaxis protein|uniref:CheY chemotaxis protein or a CheY-like REC (Receiver) domain n=3 Tax=Methanosarcina thermophila TaxID=2210 RepID=A0A1I7AFG6_METTE|nr:response regulator [Methanosarcina thermophila]ALK06147.1 MAG: chemotaxis protein CheY [Methanosarcina sp. 795]AKB12242.1 response regulator receiver [Methanosarcina thermophila TM-1]AKB14555.1 response regulator receiver [Methanosarcina thermophila CHTI-55]NLU58139.1 response regulator [Methanosarcina thermophila]SFT73677.1 CheY chemotaxis protein or a CheY-like REC (receiver) domain [Methanosarcina thermophila]
MVEGKILIVEDEHIVAMGIRAMLKNLGYTVTGVASSGEEAISKAESTRPDLVLMDIMLKGDLDGIEASKEIKKRSGIPVVYLTACSDRKILEKIWNTGSGYIIKPFDEKDLKNGIDPVLMQYRLEKKNVKRNPEKLREDSGRLSTPSNFLSSSERPK